MHKTVIAFADNALELGRSVALAILTESGRDTPGLPGAMLALCSDGSRAGTIGGGNLEAKVLKECADALASPGTAVRAFDHSLGEGGDVGMVCGGEVKGIITVMRPEKRLIVFGGGHVGLKVCEAGLVAGFSVTVIEDREEYASRFPGAEVIIAADFAVTARELNVDRDCYIVVATRGHAQDSAVIRELIGREYGYLGMIGSSKKVAGMREMLRKHGADAEAIEGIFTPIGIDIDDGTPGEIAVGIVAEILVVKNRRDVLRHRRDRD